MTDEQYRIKFYSRFGDVAISEDTYTMKEILDSYLPRLNEFCKYELIKVDDELP